MLKLTDLTIAYLKGDNIIEGLNLDVEEGTSLGIIGANGAGKTTLFKGMLGLLNTSGEICIDGIRLDKKSLADIRRKVGYVSSDSDAQMFMPTVYEDMMFAPMNYGMDKEEAETRVMATLEMLNILPLLHEHNYKLSDGQKRMASIAVALVMNPRLLLMDEPSASLDPKNRRVLINTMLNIDTSKIIATHDLDLVLEVCDRVIIMNKGTIVADGETYDILANKELLEANNLELPLCMAGLPKNM